MKIISLPSKNIGYFVNVYEEMRKIKVREILHIEAELRFSYNKSHDRLNDHRVYSLKFAPVIIEPDYNTLNEFCSKLETFPKVDMSDESRSYRQKTFLGKEYNLRFVLNNSEIWDGEFEFEEIEEEEVEEEKEEEEVEYEVCPRNIPIKKNGKCVNSYCTDEEFEKGICKISNVFLETQWFNKFNYFDGDVTSFVSTVMNDQEDVFIFAQRDESNLQEKFLFGFNKEGRELFYNDINYTFTSFLKFDYPYIDFSDKITHIQIGNNRYLFVPTAEKFHYLIDYENPEGKINVNSLEIETKYYHYKYDTFFKLKGSSNEYFSDFIYCANGYLAVDCNIVFRKYTVNSKTDIKITYEKPVNDSYVNPATKLTCVQNADDFIQCIYSVSYKKTGDEKEYSKHMLGFFEPKYFNLVKEVELESEFDEYAAFDSMITLKDYVSVIAYSSEKNLINVYLKKITADLTQPQNPIFSINDYIKDVPYIEVNKQYYYEFEGGRPSENTMLKLTDDRFAMILNDYKNSQTYGYLHRNLLILMFDIYGENQYIVMRHHYIDFGLYGVQINGETKGFLIGEFFGIAVELTSKTSEYESMAAFLTFGFVNSTQEDISVKDGTENLINRKLPIYFRDYIGNIENNLFGYYMLGVGIRYLPPEEAGVFYGKYGDDEIQISENEIHHINSSIRFVPNPNNKGQYDGIYSIVFAAIVQEPEYLDQNWISNEYEIFPETPEGIPEDLVDVSNILVGKEFTYNFKIETEKSEKEEEEEEEETIDVNEKCQRKKPILKNGECVSVYCTKEEFRTKVCEIGNSFIKTQWLNTFHLFDEDDTSYIAATDSDKGDVFLLAQRKDNTLSKKFIYGFKSNGNGYFYNKKNDTYNSLIIFDYPNVDFSDRLKYIEIANKGYLFTAMINKNNYLIDYNSDNGEVSVNVIKDNSEIEEYKTDAFFKLKGTTNEYFTDFIYCDNNDSPTNCSISFRKYTINSKTDIKLSYEKKGVLIKVNPKTILTCMQNVDNYIQCTYTFTVVNSTTKVDKSMHVFGIFEPKTFNVVQNIVLEDDYNPDAAFDSMIILKDNVSVIAYSSEENIIKVLIKKMGTDFSNREKPFILSDYIEEVSFISLNKQKYYEIKESVPSENSLIAVNERKFIMILNDHKSAKEHSHLHSNLVIITFEIYGDNKHVLIRHHIIDFGLYGVQVNGDTKWYVMDEFFGIAVELSSPNDEINSRSAFFTFGFVNTTKEDTSIEEGTENLIKQNKSIVVRDYIGQIENNLFGYELSNVLITNLPREEIGTFISKYGTTEKQLVEDEVIPLNSTITFYPNYANINTSKYNGNYYISFASVIEEPEFEEKNWISNRYEIYPTTDIKNIPEDYYDEYNVLIGKEYKYNFKIDTKKEEEKKECYYSCLNCTEYSTSLNDQKCIVCKTGFYFQENTKNCFSVAPKKYYFDSEKKIFAACYPDCGICSGKSTDKKKMNCVSCDYPFKYYNTGNCFNCPKYVNYEQTECIDEIPDGYFVTDQYRGIINKCHELCKTCKAQSYLVDNIVHMNCDSCLYNNSKFKTDIIGNCPEKNATYNDDEKEKTNDNKGLGFLAWFGIIGGFLLVTVIVVVVIMVFMKKKENNDIPISDYKNIHGNIALQEDAGLGI